MRPKFFFPSLALALLIAGPASAHSGAGTVFSFQAGLLHPLGGPDHLLAMFAVGLLAAQLGGRAIWLVPGRFRHDDDRGRARGHFGFGNPRN